MDCPLSQEVIDREGLGQIVADALWSNRFGNVEIRRPASGRDAVASIEDVSYN